MYQPTVIPHHPYVVTGQEPYPYASVHDPERVDREISSRIRLQEAKASNEERHPFCQGFQTNLGASLGDHGANCFCCIVVSIVVIILFVIVNALSGS